MRRGPSRRSPTTSCCPAQARSRPRANGSGRGLTTGRSPTPWRSSRRRGARRDRSRRLRRVPHRPAGRRRLCHRGRACPRGPGVTPFTYTILRVVPSVERGEQLNVGVVLFCRQRGFLGARVGVDEDRLRTLAPGLDLSELAAHLEGLVRVADGNPAAGAIATLPASRALRVAGGSVEHGDSGLAGAHWAQRRSRGHTRRSVRAAGRLTRQRPATRSAATIRPPRTPRIRRRPGAGCPRRHGRSAPGRGCGSVRSD